MKLIITGGCGFIGSNFIRYWMDKYPDDEILNLDKLTYAGNTNNLGDYTKKENYCFYHGSINNPKILDNILSRNIDCIVNFAAESHVDRSIDNSNSFIESNFLGVHSILEAILRNKKQLRLVQISTDEVYGSLELESNDKFTENRILSPNNPYSASKAAADLLVKSYVKTYGIDACITRCSNNYGPNQYPEKLIPLMVKKATSNEFLPLYGDGLNVRDWIYVLDHCRAIDCVIRKGKTGEIYNIGDNNEISNKDMVKKILRILGKDESLIKYVEDRLGHDRKYAISYDKINKDLGWYPEFDFNTFFEKTIKDMSSLY